MLYMWFACFLESKLEEIIKSFHFFKEESAGKIYVIIKTRLKGDDEELNDIFGGAGHGNLANEF